MVKGLIILNCKNYIEIAGEKILQLAEIANKISKEYQIDVMLAPPNHSLFHVAKSVEIPIICQHLDNEKTGSTTGFAIPEIAKSYGASGSIINHSEHRIEYNRIQNLIERLRNLKMISIVCASTAKEVGELTMFNPEMIAIEPPELIGTGKAVSKINPSIITESVIEARKHSEDVRVICGAGIMDGADVSSAINLGSQGILIASGVIKAKFWKDKLAELAQAFD